MSKLRIIKYEKMTSHSTSLESLPPQVCLLASEYLVCRDAADSASSSENDYILFTQFQNENTLSRIY